ncbi:hypothetical protein MRB53_004846 [Persea americana]|uniref:Uncharacterized protein n=1 Tax=Persea americana TaxID=3435 RepID=A0ACC2MCD3_PERAE|nr:hypothetical protein MRB53_004846 [Persea americana]
MQKGVSFTPLGVTADASIQINNIIQDDEQMLEMETEKADKAKQSPAEPPSAGYKSFREALCARVATRKMEINLT